MLCCVLVRSLQSEVKRLKEEREESFRGCDEKLGSKKGSSEVKLEDFWLEKLGDKDENLEAYQVKLENDTVRTESGNGSTDSISKEMRKMAMAMVKVEGEGEVGANELIDVCEMVAESKKFGERENLDVQSTTSRLRKENEKLHFGGAGRENDSLLSKEMSSVSHPLIDFLEILQSCKLSLVSEKLLAGQVYVVIYIYRVQLYLGKKKDHLIIGYIVVYGNLS